MAWFNREALSKSYYKLLLLEMLPGLANFIHSVWILAYFHLWGWHFLILLLDFRLGCAYLIWRTKSSLYLIKINKMQYPCVYSFILFTYIEPIRLIDSASQSINTEHLLCSSTVLATSDIKLIKIEILPSWCSQFSGHERKTISEHDIKYG